MGTKSSNESHALQKIIRNPLYLLDSSPHRCLILSALAPATLLLHHFEPDLHFARAATGPRPFSQSTLSGPAACPADPCNTSFGSGGPSSPIPHLANPRSSSRVAQRGQVLVAKYSVTQHSAAKYWGKRLGQVPNRCSAEGGSTEPAPGKLCDSSLPGRSQSASSRPSEALRLGGPDLKFSRLLGQSLSSGRYSVWKCVGDHGERSPGGREPGEETGPRGPRALSTIPTQPNPARLGGTRA